MLPILTSLHYDQLPGADMAPGLSQLAERQCGIVHRGQLASLGISCATIDAQFAAKRWRECTACVIAMSNGALTREQLMHVAVLNAGRPVALASATCLERHRLTAFPDPTIHIVVERASRVSEIVGVRIHESRRFTPDDIEWHLGLPLCAPARGAIDRAAWQPWPRFSYAVLAAVVQQRLATVDALRTELDAAGRIRHAAHMRLALGDIAGGAEALSEIDLRRLCRRFRIVAPSGQRVRCDRTGRRRYLDCEWVLPDGSVLVLEVDGSHHLDVGQWDADMPRERQVVLSASRVLRCSAHELRLTPAVVARDLIDAGVPRIPELSVRGGVTAP